MSSVPSPTKFCGNAALTNASSICTASLDNCSSLWAYSLAFFVGKIEHLDSEFGMQRSTVSLNGVVGVNVRP